MVSDGTTFTIVAASGNGSDGKDDNTDGHDASGVDAM